MQRTLVILKPDAVEKGLVLEVFNEIHGLGLTLVAHELRQLTAPVVREHYAHLADKPFFPRIAAFMTRGPVMLAIFQGDSAVARVRELAGATDPRQADPKSLRARYGFVTPEGGMENVIHCSATPEEAEQEIGRFYPDLVGPRSNI